MMELTKERLQEIESVLSAGALGYSVEADEVLAMARQLLAGLEQEPVAYIDPFTFKNFATYRAGEADNKRMGREWVWANPDAGLIPLYAAPQLPQPAVVPSNELLSAMEEVLRISDRDHEAWHRVRKGIADFRAAMLQGAEPVQAWIPCSERMPEFYFSVLATDEHEDMVIALPVYLDAGDRCAFQLSNGDIFIATHWMPLPAAPQQEVK